MACSKKKNHKTSIDHLANCCEALSAAAKGKRRGKRKEKSLRDLTENSQELV